jgi:hypothetical protein
MSIEKEIKKIVSAEIAQVVEKSDENFKMLMAELLNIKAMVESGGVNEDAPAEEAPAEEVPAITYEDLKQNGWTDEQIGASEYAELLPAKPAVTDEDREAIIAGYRNQIPGNDDGRFNEALNSMIAKAFGVSNIEDVSNDDIYNKTELSLIGLNECLTYATAAATISTPKPTGAAVPPPPPGKSAEGATAPASQSTAFTPAPPAEGVESTEKVLLTEASMGAPVPPAPIFTPGGIAQ